MMRRLLLSLLLIALLVGCAQQTRSRESCPEYPIPSAHVQQKLDALAEEDREVWEWGNKLLILCQQLGTCEEEGFQDE